MHRENHNKIYQTTTSYYSKKYLMLIKNIFFLLKKWEIQVIMLCMLMLTLWFGIFNPKQALRCTFLVYISQYLHVSMRAVLEEEGCRARDPIPIKTSKSFFFSNENKNIKHFSEHSASTLFFEKNKSSNGSYSLPICYKQVP